MAACPTASRFPSSSQYHKGFEYGFPVSGPVYGTPLPPPATYDSRRPPSWLVFYFLFLIGLILACFISVLVVFAVLQPQAPNFAIQDATVHEFDLTTNNWGVYLSSDMLFIINVRNRNKRIGIYYDEGNAQVWYEGGLIGQGSIAPFYQGHKNTTLVSLHVTGRDVAIPQEVGTTLGANEQSILLKVNINLLVRKKILRWKTGSKKLHVTCDVLPTVSSLGKTQILNKHCDLMTY